jgi:putative transposase
MAAECATTAITRMARLLGVSTSGYYKRAKRSVTTSLTDREQRKADLTVKIIDHHRDSGGTYGSPRITADLRAGGEQVSEKTVAKIMAEIGLAGISEFAPKAHYQRRKRQRRKLSCWTRQANPIRSTLTLS